MTPPNNADIDARAANALRQDNLLIFLMGAIEVIEPQIKLARDDYLEALCFALQTAALKDGGRLMVTMPPRYLKSITTSVILCAWILGLNPRLQIMVASYADDLATDLARKFRTLVESGFYRSVFPEAAIRPKRATATAFVTAQGGGRRAVTIGGSVTGMGADLIIVDDIMKAKDASSDAKRQEARRFFDETLYSRLNDKSEGSVLVVQQRLHQDDLIAHLQDRGTFDHLNLPAIATQEETHFLYRGNRWTRSNGDVLAPSREHRAALDAIRADIGPAAFATQYQQDPASAGSSMLDFSKVSLLDGLARDHRWLRTIQTWDTAIKDGPDCDYSVGMTFGWNDERWVVLDVVRRKMKFDALKTEAIRQFEKWRPERVVVEESANGSAMVADLRNAGHREFRLLPPKGSKEERFNVAVSFIENGRIALLPQEDYFQDLRRELLAFPEGRHDDQVDALSLFVRRIRMKRPLPGDKRN